MNDEHATTVAGPRPQSSPADPAGLLCLIIAWSAGAPESIGEVALITSEHQPWLIGRGPQRPDDAAERLRFYRQRPDAMEPGKPLGGAGISRQQLRLIPEAGALRVERIGRCPLLVNGEPVDHARVQPGDTLLLQGELLLLCARRPPRLSPLHHFPSEAVAPFGQADAMGLVGESPAVWSLRERLAYYANTAKHVLVLGPSGTGKELAARAVHRLSPRHARALVARNAATIPRELVDAELFGNARNYPNPGMSERPGLIGEADQSTLFLDEIGEVPSEVQAHLLRVLDAGGEYHRLGEQRARRADVRLIGATNRPLDQLKQDLVARMPLRLTLPGLAERREDIPLLVRHLLRAEAAQHPGAVARFFPCGDATKGEARLDPVLMDRLLRHPYTLHVRELLGLLWRAMAGSEGDVIALTAEVEDDLSAGVAPPPQEEAAQLPAADEIRASLAQHDGNLSKVWPALGLRNRFVLYRLMKKYGLSQPDAQGR